MFSICMTATERKAQFSRFHPGINQQFKYIAICLAAPDGTITFLTQNEHVFIGQTEIIRI